MKLSRLLSIVKLGIDVLLSEHLQSRCIDSSMYRYTPNKEIADLFCSKMQANKCFFNPIAQLVFVVPRQ